MLCKIRHLVAAVTKKESAVVSRVEAGERVVVVVLNGVVEHVDIVVVAKLRRRKCRRQIVGFFHMNFLR